jgi:hypothetical protein
MGGPEGRHPAGSKLFERRTDALIRARRQAKRERAELVIKTFQGQIGSAGTSTVETRAVPGFESPAARARAGPLDGGSAGTAPGHPEPVPSVYVE